MNKPDMTLVVTEGIAGMWHYHLSHKDSKHRGLCGARTMHTSIPLERWGAPPPKDYHLRQSWCSDCEKHR